MESITPSNKKPSSIFLELCKNFAENYLTSKTIATDIIERAKMENLTPPVVRQYVEAALKVRGLSTRTITRALPDELKIKTKPKGVTKKGTALVTTWDIIFDLTWLEALNAMAEQHVTRCYLTHDNRKVVDVRPY
jgi:hypothetical protein